MRVEQEAKQVEQAGKRKELERRNAKGIANAAVSRRRRAEELHRASKGADDSAEDRG